MFVCISSPGPCYNQEDPGEYVPNSISVASTVDYMLCCDPIRITIMQPSIGRAPYVS